MVDAPSAEHGCKSQFSYSSFATWKVLHDTVGSRQTAPDIGSVGDACQALRKRLVDEPGADCCECRSAEHWLGQEPGGDKEQGQKGQKEKEERQEQGEEEEKIREERQHLIVVVFRWHIIIPVHAARDALVAAQ